jgi:hypothetical protein
VRSPGPLRAAVPDEQPDAGPLLSPVRRLTGRGSLGPVPRRVAALLTPAPSLCPLLVAVAAAVVLVSGSPRWTPFTIFMPWSNWPRPGVPDPLLTVGVLRPDDPGPADMDRADDAQRSTWPIA